MSNLVLYRKYRPKTFSEVVGQEHVVKTLTNAISENMAGHGYLFSGPHGCGKTTLARLLAKALNCQNRQKGQFEPCNKCSSCLEINQGNAIDLIEIDAASNRGIDEIRELKEGIRFQPTKSKYKVFILDEAHQLSKDAANALLKTLEEPPSHAVFVLATTEIHKMLPTIQSRCQTFSFRKLKFDQIIKRLEDILKKEKIKFEKPALDLIAIEASGSIRDAETLLDEVVNFTGKEGAVKKELVQTLLGSADKTAIFRFLDFLEQKQAKPAIELLNNLIFEGVDIKEFIKAIISAMREILLIKIGSQTENLFFLSLTDKEKQQIKKLIKNFNEQELKFILEKLNEAQNKMKYSSIIQLPLELAIVDICFKNQ